MKKSKTDNNLTVIKKWNQDYNKYEYIEYESGLKTVNYTRKDYMKVLLIFIVTHLIFININ